MIVVASFSFVLFLIINLNAFLVLQKKSLCFDDLGDKKSTNYLFVRWTALISMNVVIILIIPLGNLYYKTQINQTLIDNLATVGFALTLLVSAIIYIYILRLRKVVYITHSLGHVIIYSLQYSLISMMTIYYIFS